MTYCIVTDIDGTIAEHTSANGSAWEKAITEQPPKPIIPMRTLLQAAAQGGLYVVYATARREMLRTLTNGWLVTEAFPMPAKLLMRPDDLRLAQDVLKLRYLKELRAEGWQPVVWFEDNRLTAETLKSAGVHAIGC